MEASGIVGMTFGIIGMSFGIMSWELVGKLRKEFDDLKKNLEDFGALK